MQDLAGFGKIQSSRQHRESPYQKEKAKKRFTKKYDCRKVKILACHWLKNPKPRTETTWLFVHSMSFVVLFSLWLKLCKKHVKKAKKAVAVLVECGFCNFDYLCYLRWFRCYFLFITWKFHVFFRYFQEIFSFGFFNDLIIYEITFPTR